MLQGGRRNGRSAPMSCDIAASQASPIRARRARSISFDALMPRCLRENQISRLRSMTKNRLLRFSFEGMPGIQAGRKVAGSGIAT